jgi:hypothetical protein
MAARLERSIIEDACFGFLRQVESSQPLFVARESELSVIYALSLAKLNTIKSFSLAVFNLNANVCMCIYVGINFR